MEKYLLVRNQNGWFPIQVSVRLYEEIMRYMESTEQQGADLFTNVDLEEMKRLGLEQEGLLQPKDHGEKMDSIFVKDRDYFRRIDFSRIRWVEASGSYCCLYLENNSKMMLSFNLRELTVHLPSRLFLRVHRSYMVNIQYIDSFIGNMLIVGKNQIPVSKQHKHNVITRLNILGNVK